MKEETIVLKKRAFSLFLCLAMTAGILSGCGKSASEQTSTATSAVASTAEASSQQASAASESSEPAEVYMFINSPEYADAINTAITEYKKVAPNVTINYETTQSDYPTLLKAKINSGEIPDIFASTAGGEIKAYAEYSQDLTNEPLASAMTDAVKTNMS